MSCGSVAACSDVTASVLGFPVHPRVPTDGQIEIWLLVDGRPVQLHADPDQTVTALKSFIDCHFRPSPDFAWSAPLGGRPKGLK
jgi:hypothetical protein